MQSSFECHVWVCSAEFIKAWLANDDVVGIQAEAERIPILQGIGGNE
jgi:hypothetical protein